MGAKPPVKIKISFTSTDSSEAVKTAAREAKTTEKPPVGGSTQSGAPRTAPGVPRRPPFIAPPREKTQATEKAQKTKKQKQKELGTYRPGAPSSRVPITMAGTRKRGTKSAVPVRPMPIPAERTLVTAVAWVGRQLPAAAAPGNDPPSATSPNGDDGAAVHTPSDGGRGNDLYITELTETIRGAGTVGDDVKITTRPLTAGGLCEGVPPRFSPDGRQVAYVAADGWLRRRDLESGKDTALMQINPYASFAWSPDSARLVVDGLTVIEAVTGETTTLKGDGLSPRWLPRGHHILFARSHQLWVAEWPEGDEAPLPGLPLETRADLQVSPDGHRAAYTVLSGSTSGVGIVDLESATAVMIDTGSDRVLHPRWSPDGSRLLVTSTRFRPSSGKLARLGEMVSLHPDGSIEGILAVSTCLQGGAGGWTASGQRIIFKSCGEAGEIGGGIPGLYTVEARSGALEADAAPRPLLSPEGASGISVAAFDTYTEPLPT